MKKIGVVMAAFIFSVILSASISVGVYAETGDVLGSYDFENVSPVTDSEGMMHSFYALANDGNGLSLIKLYVEEMYNPTSGETDKRSYKLLNIAQQHLSAKSSANNSPSSVTSSAANYTVSDLFNLVKQYDTKFNPESASKVVNEDGTPKVMYHGTPNSFTIFKPQKSQRSQLENYIIQKNNSSKTIKDVDCKEIGDHFYIWHNNSKDDFTLSDMIDIEGNEDIINSIREMISNGTNRSTADISRVLHKYWDGRNSNNRSNDRVKKAGNDRSNDRFLTRQSESDEGRYFRGNSEDTTQNKTAELNAGIKSDTQTSGFFDAENNPDIRYSVKDNANKIKADFGITNINDYIHVQRSVNQTLLNEGFFDDKGNRSKTVINDDSGMSVEITPKGIKETFGDKNFIGLSSKLKLAKIAVVRDLPNLIKNGSLTEDNVANRHNPNSSVKYAYITAETSIDGEPVTVNIDIRKSPQKNKFWVHSLDFEHKNSGVPSQTKSGVGSNVSANNDSVTKFTPNVKYSIKENNETKFTPNADINEIVNSDMTDAEKRKVLEDRAHFIPQGGRDLFAEAQQKGKEHFDKMHKVKPSEYSEEDWQSLDDDLSVENVQRDMNERVL